MSKNIKLIIADDQAIFMLGVKCILDTEPDLEIIEEKSDIESLVKSPNLVDANILLVGLNRGNRRYLDSLKKILRTYFHIKIIVISLYADEYSIVQFVKAGIHGILFKNVEPKTVLQAINEVYTKGYFLSENIHPMLINNVQNYTRFFEFTEREIEILNLMTRGYPSKLIAEKLYLSPATIEGHRKELLRKTDSQSSAQVIAYAFRNNLIE